LGKRVFLVIGLQLKLPSIFDLQPFFINECHPKLLAKVSSVEYIIYEIYFLFFGSHFR